MYCCQALYFNSVKSSIFKLYSKYFDSFVSSQQTLLTLKENSKPFTNLLNVTLTYKRLFTVQNCKQQNKIDLQIALGAPLERIRYLHQLFEVQGDQFYLFFILISHNFLMPTQRSPITM